MSDRPQSKPPPPEPPAWDDSAGWRETYLRELPESRRPLARELAAWLMELSRESGFVAVPESLTRSELEAIGSDLRYIEGALAHVAHHVRECSLERRELHLVALAAELAPEVGSVAQRIETALC